MPDYPDIEKPALATGEASEIVPGLLWLRMPAPGQLQAINVWAIAGNSGWIIIDTGIRGTRTAGAWRAAFDGVLAKLPLERLCLTHMHPDHSGMAGWLTKHHGLDLWMTRLEFYQLRTLVAYTGQEAPPSAIDFYRAAGWDSDDIDEYLARFGTFGEMIYPLPDSFIALSDGDRLPSEIGEWEVVTGKGHSPEQALFYNAKAKLLISGDQVLPRISSNVSVYPQEPKADPLSDWLQSLAAIKARVPDDVLVLPSHGRPFHGLHARIDTLLAGHEEGMQRILQLLTQPCRAIDTFSALFKREIDPEVAPMATGEGLAHLACLRARGLVSSRRDEHGQEWWFLAGQESN